MTLRLILRSNWLSSINLLKACQLDYHFLSVFNNGTCTGNLLVLLMIVQNHINTSNCYICGNTGICRSEIEFLDIEINDLSKSFKALFLILFEKCGNIQSSILIVALDSSPSYDRISIPSKQHFGAVLKWHLSEKICSKIPNWT